MSTLDWIAIISAITTSSLNILQIYQLMKQEEIVIRKIKSQGKSPSIQRGGE